MKVINHNTNEVEDLPSSHGIDALMGGSHSILPDEEYAVRLSDGSLTTERGSKVKDLIESKGAFFHLADHEDEAELVTDVTSEQAKIEQIDQSMRDPASAEEDFEPQFIEDQDGEEYFRQVEDLKSRRRIDPLLGAAKSITYGLSEMAGVLLPEEMEKRYKERIKEARELDEGYQAGEIGGAIAGAAIKGPADLVIRGATKIPQLMQLGKAVSKAPVVGKPIVGAAKLGTAAAAEGAAYSAGEGLARNYINDEKFVIDSIFDEITSGAIGAGDIGAKIGFVLPMLKKAGSAVSKSVSRKADKSISEIEPLVNDSLAEFVKDVKNGKVDNVLQKPDKQLGLFQDKVLQSPAELGHKMPDVFERTEAFDTGRQGIKFSYDKADNTYKYSDRNREVVVDSGKLFDDLNAIDLDNLSKHNEEFKASDLYLSDKLIDYKALEKGNVKDALRDVYELNQRVSGNSLSKLVKIGKTELATKLEKWQNSAQNLFKAVEVKGSLEPWMIKEKNRLLSQFREIQTGLTGKVLTIPEINKLTKVSMRKRFDSVINTFDGYKKGDSLFVFNPEQLGSYIQSSAAKISVKPKALKSWEESMIRYAGGGKVAAVKNISKKQLEDAAQFISENSGGLIGDLEKLSQATSAAITSSGMKINDALIRAQNFANAKGININIKANRVANFIDDIADKYVNKSSKKVEPHATPYYNFIKSKADEWRAQVNELGEVVQYTPKEIQNRKVMLSSEIKQFNRDISKNDYVERDLKAIIGYLDDAIMDSIQKADPSGSEFFSKLYEEGKKTYGTGKTVEKIIIGEVNQAMVRNKIPLTGYLSAGLGASMGASAGEALMYAAVGAATRTAIKNQGDYWAGKFLQKLDTTVKVKEKALNNSVAKFFSPSFDRFAAKVSLIQVIKDSKDIRQAYEKERSQLKKMVEKAGEIKTVSEPIRDFSEMLADGIEQKTMDSFTFLMDKFPNFESAIIEKDWQPAASDFFSYMRYKDAFFNLDGILKDFGNLIITKEQTEVLREIYPSIHRELYIKTMDESQGKRLRQEQRQVLNKVFGLKDSINSAQMMKFRAPEQEDQQPQQQNQRTRKTNKKFTGQERTRNERILER